MPLLGSPLWLVGLALLWPLRALHRWRGSPPPVRVPAAFLWRDSPSAVAAGARRAEPDPAWRRRALTVVLLLGTLASPGWRPGAPPDTEVLVDNRPSLLAREGDGRPRTAWAAESLTRALKEAGVEHFRLLPRDGRAPAVALASGDVAGIEGLLSEWGTEAADTHAGAPTLLTPPGVRRWLLGDGSGRQDPRAPAGAAPFERVVAVGSVGDNQGLVSLAARPALSSPELLDLWIEASNPGTAEASRTLVLSGVGRTLAQTSLRLPAGGSAFHALQIPRDIPGPVEARLEPPDALVSDDRLALDLTPLLPASLALTGDCGPAVAALTAAVPGLLPAGGPSDSGARIAIRCDADPPLPTDPPTLWLPPGESLPPEAPPPRWMEPSSVRRLPDQAPPLSAGSLRPIAVAAVPAGRVLLAAGDRPLVIEARTPDRLVGLFDTGPGAAAGPDLPLLLAALLGRLARQDLLSPVAVATRDPDLVRIAPGPLARIQTPAPAPARAPTPLWAAPLAAALALLLLDLWLALRAARPAPGALRRNAAALRTLAIALALAGLVLPFRPGEPGPVHLLALLDASDSMPLGTAETAWSALAPALGDLPKGSRLSVVRFGARPALELAGLRPDRDPLPASLPQRLPVDRSATHVAAALHSALALLSPGESGLVLLVSDGIETLGEQEPWLVAAREAGIPVLRWSPTDGASGPDARVESLAVGALPDGTLAATVRLAANRPATARLELRMDGRPAGERQVRLSGVAPAEMDVPLAIGGELVPGAHELTATVRADGDRRPANDLRGVLLPIAGPPRVRLVGRDPASSAVAAALAVGGVDLSLDSPETFDPAALAATRALILEGLTPAMLPQSDWQAIERAVTRGGLGLIVLGGPGTFGAGGYRHSVLEGLLPLTAEAPERRPAASILYALDKSGSMAQPTRLGTSRLELARRATLGSARSLAPRDASALLVFDAVAETLLPLAARPDPAQAIERAWRALPGGGTRLAPVIEQALALLGSEGPGQRLLVLASDGQVSDPERAADLGRGLAAAGVEALILGVGEGEDSGPLSELASAAGGDFRQVSDLAMLPELMQAEVDRRRHPVEPGPLRPSVQEPLPFAPAPATPWPELLAYPVARARESARVHLAAPNGDPLLVSGWTGAARVLALPAGLAEWAPDWPGWSGWGDLLAGMVGWVSGGSEHWSGQIVLDERTGPELRLEGTDTEDRWASPDPFAVRVLDPLGHQWDFRVRPVAPGQLAAALPEAPAGLYRLLLGPPAGARLDLVYRPELELLLPETEEVGDPGKPPVWSPDPRDRALGLPLPRRTGVQQPLWVFASLAVFLAALLVERLPRLTYSRLWRNAQP